MTADKIQETIQHGANSLLEQFKYSAGVFSAGESEITESALVVHVASAFIQRGCCVWPEAIFGPHGERPKHLDLCIVLNPGGDPSILLILEFKAIGLGHVATKADEVIKDIDRVCAHYSKNPPLTLLDDLPKEVWSGVCVLLCESCDGDSKVSPKSLSECWESNEGTPNRTFGPLLKTLEQAGAICRQVVRGRYTDGSRLRSVAFALFPAHCRER